MKLNTALSLVALSDAVYNVAALPAFAANVDLNAKVPLNAFKRSSHTGETANVGGHNIPIEHLATLVKDTLAEGFAASENKVEKRATFDAKAQLIDVHGDHVFMMPNFTAGDVRGPCPGLNTLANHNYLPRNGMATIAQYLEATQKVWGMSADISIILAVYGTVFGGNILSLNPGVSVGGVSTVPSVNEENILGNLGGLLGTPRGLTNTHNTFEVDGSITRGDLYDPIGNTEELNMTLFRKLYDRQKDAEEPNYTVDVMFENAVDRWYQDIAYNPDFIYLPWSGWFVRNAAIIFSSRLFVNCSEEHPEGTFSKEGLKAIYGVWGDSDDNLTYISGSDYIPENYYRRADDFRFMDGLRDLMNQTVVKYPVLFSIGGNTNGVNTFAGLDLANITGGVLNAENLLEGNNALCFAFQFLKLGVPSMLNNLFSTVGPVLEKLTDALDPILLSLACPAFENLSVGGEDLFEYIKKTYPGAAKSGGAL